MKASWHLQSLWQRVLLWWRCAIQPRRKSIFAGAADPTKVLGNATLLYAHAVRQEERSLGASRRASGSTSLSILPPCEASPIRAVTLASVVSDSPSELRWGHLPASQDGTSRLIQMVPQQSVLKGSRLQRVEKPKLWGGQPYKREGWVVGMCCTKSL